MANVIKHKRGSGSDPVASDLVVGEVAIRTDVGKLFTKMDNGSVAEIAGGGSDIAINTLSSSSGTGGGSATFNGSAYRFTLSAPPSVSAQQLLVSINGVIQKPVAGTGQPSEGFSVDGTDIILGDAPATGSDFFILTFKSLGVSEPADNSVTSAKIVDGAIVNADINASAAIAGTKISPDFGSQAITTTNDSVTIGNSIIHSGDTDTKINFPAANTFTINTAGAERLRVDSSGRVGIGVTNPDRELDISNSSGNCTISLRSSDSHTTQLLFGDVSAELRGRVGYQSSDVLDFYTAAAERMRIDSSGNVGIGTASPAYTNALFGGSQRTFHLSGTAAPQLRIQSSTSGQADLLLQAGNSGSTAYIANAASGGDLFFSTNNGGSQGTRFAIKDDGKVGIGTSSPSRKLHLVGLNPMVLIEGSGGNGRQYALASSDDTTGAAVDGGNAGTFAIYDDTANAARLVINSSGNVGIGTTSPNTELHIKGAGSILKLETTATTGNGYMSFNDADEEKAFIGLGSSINDSLSIWLRKNSHMRFATNNTERMTIDGSGKVGIGTTSPSNFLEIEGGSTTSTQVVVDGTGRYRGLEINENGTRKAYFHHDATDNKALLNTAEGILTFATGDTERMRINSSGKLLVGTSSDYAENVQAAFYGASNGGIALASGTSGLSRLMFADATSGNAGAYVGSIIYAHSDNSLRFNVNGGIERMRIDSAGKVFIGTTSGSERLKVETTANTMVPMTINDSSNTSTLTHRILFSTGGTEVGRIRCTNSATQYNTSGSDRSMKKNFELWDEDVLSLFKNINPQKFNFIQEEDGATKSKGFIAQELANSFPEAYSKGEKEDDKYWFNPSGMVVYLMKALQEAVARIEALEAK